MCVNLSETLKMRERVSLYSIKRNDYVISTNKRTAVYLYMRVLFHNIILKTSTTGKVQ